MPHLAWCWPHPSPCCPWTHPLASTHICGTWLSKRQHCHVRTILGLIHSNLNICIVRGYSQQFNFFFFGCKYICFFRNFLEFISLYSYATPRGQTSLLCPSRWHPSRNRQSLPWSGKGQIRTRYCCITVMCTINRAISLPIEPIRLPLSHLAFYWFYLKDVNDSFLLLIHFRTRFKVYSAISLLSTSQYILEMLICISRRDLRILWDQDCLLLCLVGALHYSPGCSSPGRAGLLGESA